MSPAETNPVDGEKVPSRHFGAILDWDDSHVIRGRLGADGTDFIIAPTTRFANEVGEQATMFFRDPSGNALEFTTFRDKSMIFAHLEFSRIVRRKNNCRGSVLANAAGCL